jgi:hypothetical protein
MARRKRAVIKMKSQAILVGMLFTTMMIVPGCDKIGLSGPTSIKVFDNCFQNGKEAGSTRQASVKAACIEKHQSDIPDVVEGKAGYGSCLPEDEWERDATGKLVVDMEKLLPIIKNANVPRTCESFEGTLTNNSPKYVVTSVTIHVKAAGSTQDDTSTIAGLWLEKGQSTRFSFPVNYKPTKAGSNDTLKEKYKWWTDTHKGFSVDY